MSSLGIDCRLCTRLVVRIIVCAVVAFFIVLTVSEGASAFSPHGTPEGASYDYDVGTAFANRDAVKPAVAAPGAARLEATVLPTALGPGYNYDSSVSFVAPSAARHLCSFSGETEVLMADGTTKPISEVEVGDLVLAEDPETGERGARQVTHLWVHEDTIVDLEIGGHDVATTEDHPFWNHTDSEWQRADALDPGDLVLTADGATLTVGGMDWGSTRTTTAYNLTVDDIHTYFVQVGDEPVLVHNICLGDDWVAREVPDLISTSDCRSCAADILERLGQGELVTVTPSGSAPGLGGYRGADTLWTDHVVVVTDGRVFDAYGPAVVVPIDEWKNLWQYPDALDFGGL